MFCNNCGSQMERTDAFCPRCGALNKAADADLPLGVQQPTASYYRPVQTQSPLPSAAPTSNVIAIVGFVLALVLPIATPGLVCCIIGLSRARRGAPYQGLAVVGIVLGVLHIFGYFIVPIVCGVFYGWVEAINMPAIAPLLCLL